MHDSAKYLIHADIEANGVVERSDVVGAIFGQTEGLLGDELDLRTLQESSKVGRIDVTIESKSGRSTGEVTIASGLDRVETAILAASLEAIDRVGPCRATIEVTHLEDVRTAKRREIVDRAEELLAHFDEEVMSSHELIEEVRKRARVERITEYQGYPAGPRVADGDAIIVVEGRADVLALLQYGIKNAVAVEGTNVPEAIADLTHDRTVTAFLDGDRGGDLILKELAQVGSVDYVAFAPAGRSVEDLSRTDVTDALREKVPYERVVEGDGNLAEIPSEARDDGTPVDEDSSTEPEEPQAEQPTDTAANDDGTAGEGATPESQVRDDTAATVENATDGATTDGGGTSAVATTETVDVTAADAVASGPDPADETVTFEDHVQAVIGESSGAIRLLDDSLTTLSEAPAAEAFETIRDADPAPATVMIDGVVTQRLLDVAAQRGVERIVASERGELVKQPAGVHVTVPEPA